MQDQKSEWTKAKGLRARDDKSSVRWSLIKGVQLLELNKMHIFLIIQASIAAAMKSKFEEIADFIDGEPVYQM